MLPASPGCMTRSPCRPPCAPGAISSAWAMPLRFARWEKAPFPGSGRCLILLLCCFPPSAAAFALLVVLRRLLGSPQGRGPAAAGRAAVHSTRPVFSGDAPAFKAAAGFPRLAQVLRDPVLTTIPGRQGGHAQRDETGQRSGGGGCGVWGVGVAWGPFTSPSSWGVAGPERARPGTAAAPPEAMPPRHQTLAGGSPGQPGAAPAVAGRAGVSVGGGRCPRCPMAARARA